MASPRPDRSRLEELWRSRLRDAKLRLDLALAYSLEVERDFPSDETRPADGNFAHYRALRAENLALVEYGRVLRIYDHLVLHGEVPDEGDYLAHPKTRLVIQRG